MFPLILTAFTWLGRIGLAVFAVNEVKKLFDDNKPLIEQSVAEAKKAGVTDDELKKLVAATTYDQVEQRGKSPDTFWGDLNQAEKDALKFSPEGLRADTQRTKFLGISQTLLWVSAAVAAGVAGFRGIPILLSTLSKLTAARAAGAGALELMTILEEGKVAGIAKVWIPGLVAGVASAGSWLTGGLTNNLNDATLWGRIFLDQAHSDIEKAAKALERGTGDGYGKLPDVTTRTRITISKSSEPKIAVGTIFQSIVKNTDAFKRVVDDAITSAEDLKTDVQLNLNNWLKTLPGRLHYEIRIVLNPLDENGNKKLGTWAVLMLGHRNSQGVFNHLQVIPLGPLEPTIYRPSSKEIETIQVDIPRLLTSEEIINLDLPTSGLQTVDSRGNITPISFGTKPIATGTPSPTAAATTPKVATFAKFTVAEQVAAKTLRPYIRFGTDFRYVFDIITARHVPEQEVVSSNLFLNSMLQERPIGDLLDFTFENGITGSQAKQVAEGAAKLIQPATPTPAAAAPTPAPTPTPTQSFYTPPATVQTFTPAPSVYTPAVPIITFPYVRYLGSPNVFDRQTGRWIQESEANSLNIFNKGLVQQFSIPRPEVKTGADYATWNNRNLTQVPV